MSKILNLIGFIQDVIGYVLEIFKVIKKRQSPPDL